MFMASEISFFVTGIESSSFDLFVFTGTVSDLIISVLSLLVFFLLLKVIE